MINIFVVASQAFKPCAGLLSGFALKSIILLCDGTWRTLEQPSPSNVALTARLVSQADPTGSVASTAQVIYYDEGLGARSGSTVLERLVGGALGAGLDSKVREAYDFLVLNYQAGDRIFLFGYSRGAYTARSLVDVLHAVGLLRAEHVSQTGRALRLARGGRADEKLSFADRLCHQPAQGDAVRSCGGTCAPEIAFLGLWDTVGALGLPSVGLLSALFRTRHRLKNRRLPPAVRSARHALAADERLCVFRHTLWSNLDNLNRCSGIDSIDEPRFQQKRFPGTHSDVGGGGGGERIGALLGPLAWVLQGAARAGLRLKPLTAE